MPFVLNDEDIQKNQNQQQQANGQNISGPSTSFNINVPGQSEKQSTGPKSSGNYQNIQKYLSANQDNAQAMGQQVANKVSGDIEGAKTETQNLGNQVQKVNAYDPNKVLGDLSNATDQQKQEYKTQKQTGGWTGPDDITGLSNYGNAYNKQQNAKTELGQVGNEVGQKELLRQTYDRPSYSGGARTLDQSLVAGSPGGRAALEGVGQNYSGFSDWLTNKNNEINQSISANKDQADQNIASFAPAETSAKSAIIDPIQARADQLNKEQPALYKQYSEDAKDNTLSPETMAALGLSNGQKIWDLNLNNYITAPLANASVQNVAKQEELDKFHNLMSFIGGDDQSLPTQEVGYKPTFLDKERLNADIQNRQKQFEDMANKTGWWQNVSYDSPIRNIWGSPERDNFDAYISMNDYLQKGINAMQGRNIPGAGASGINAWNAQHTLAKQYLDDILNKYGYNRYINSDSDTPHIARQGSPLRNNNITDNQNIELPITGNQNNGLYDNIAGLVNSNRSSMEGIGNSGVDSTKVVQAMDPNNLKRIFNL